MENLAVYWKNRKTVFAVWLMIGLILSWIAAALCTSPLGNSGDFFNYGRSCEFSPEMLNMPLGVEGITPQNGRLEITDENAKKTISLRSRDEVWSYLYVELAYMSVEKLNATLIGYDSNAQITLEKQIELYSGRNEVVLGEVPLSFFQLQFQDQIGSQFYIRGMRTTVHQDTFSRKAFFLIYVFVCLLYVFVSWCFMQYKNKVKEKPVESHKVLQTLQQLWMILSQRTANAVEEVSEKRKSKIRMLCFLGINLTVLIVSKFMNYHNSMVYRTEILIVCCFISIAAIMCLKRNMKILPYKNPLVISWYVLLILMCISDFIVKKNFMYTGYWLLFMWGFFFWAWNNMEYPQQILKEWLCAFEIVFWCSILFCLLCTVQGPELYKGMTNNSNTLGQFMSISITVFLGMLLEEKKKSYLRVIILAAALDFSVYFTILSQCRSGILADAAVILLFFMWIWKAGKKKKAQKKWLFGIILAVVMWIPVSIGSEYVMTHNSSFSGYFENRTDAAEEMEEQIANQTNPVYAAENDGITGKIKDRFINSNTLDQFSSGRISIYKKYISNMNLFGHYGNEEVYGIGMGAHNSILMIGYRYGIFTMIPYLILLFYAVWYSWRYRIRTIGKTGKYGFTVNALMITSIICGMLDHVEQPMRYMPWFVLYFLIGYFFNWDEKNDASKKNM